MGPRDLHRQNHRVSSDTTNGASGPDDTTGELLDGGFTTTREGMAHKIFGWVVRKEGSAWLGSKAHGPAEKKMLRYIGHALGGATALATKLAMKRKSRR